MNKIKDLRNSISVLLTQHYPCFEYKGHGMNIGFWETPEMVNMTKTIGSFVCMARFRISVFIPTKDGMQIKVEMFAHSVYEWETMFEGYIKDISELKHILSFQLGIKIN